MAEACPQTLAGSSDPGAAAAPLDAQLLARFAASRDEAAFALLVERHGPLVLGVCRRVLGCLQDAEDAFQATFLVLARKAGSIRDPHLLGNWLYGVASRIARKARAGVSKRQMHEKQLPLVPSLQAAPAVLDEGLSPALDEELSRLPEKYRAAVVLCYLEGKTNEEAARLLRWPTGTVKGRLARARDLLRERLVRRGLHASAVVLTTTLLAARADARPVPAALAASTVRAGVGYAGGAPPASAAARLADRVTASWRRARLLGAVLALAVVTAGAAAWLIGSGAVGREANPRGSGDSSATARPSSGCHSSAP